MKQRKNFAGFDFKYVWTIRQGRGYPTLRIFTDTSTGGGQGVGL